MSVLDDITAIAGEVGNICSIVAQTRTEQIHSIKKESMKILIWVFFLITALFFVLGGLGFIFWGLYVFIAAAMMPGWAAIIVGGAALIIGIILFMVAKNCRCE